MMGVFCPLEPLSGPANNSDWMQIGSDFSMEFSLYVVFRGTGYTGTLISIPNGTPDAFTVSVDSSSLGDNTLQSLYIQIPGVRPIRAAIPVEDDPLEFQILGISLEKRLLQIYVNCSVVHAVWLYDSPTPLAINGMSTVEILNPPTKASISCM